MVKEHKHTNGLGPCLTIPIAAKSIASIDYYVGDIHFISPDKQWLIVNFNPLEKPNHLPVWELPRASLIHQPQQCWVHRDFNGYREVYSEFFKPDLLGNLVVDHIMNRKLAKIRCYEFIRLIHVDRGVNSSSGRGSEDRVINLQKENKYESQNLSESPFNISYADPGDLLKILNIKTGPLSLLGEQYSIFY